VEDHEQGREAFESEEVYRLHSLRHSTAHVMAQALRRLHPEVKLAIGPAIQDGFYYDVELAHPIGEADLSAIEDEMRKIVKENQTFVHEEWPKADAYAYFSGQGEKFKLELIEGLADETVHIYKNPDKDGGIAFVDLCRGPHVMRTGQCKHFKLQKVSGAYWRGDATKPQLQRIYGTVWPNREALDQYLFRLEEAKKRDHRKVGKELGLFMFHEYAPGAAFWLPKGERLYNTLATRMRHLLSAEGYIVVRTPMIFDKKLWQTSGHWAHYQDNMFHFEDHHHEDHDGEHRVMGLKPMNCPSHMLIFGSEKRSYRELPLRIHDQGVLHRNEVSGALSGLTRVRQFSQDDAHIFCMPEQIGQEVANMLALIHRVYTAFGMGYSVKLSTRPAEYLGELSVWDAAEAALKGALEAAGVAYKLKEGDGAFYGPKIDFDVHDALGREFQCATIQLDFQLPIRFDLSYVGADNTPHRPVVVHRAIFGSFERFIGILIEHFAGAFPTWLAPEQVRIMTVSEKSAEYGAKVADALKARGLAVVFDDSSDKIGYKIRMAHAQKPPYQVVIGLEEAESGNVAVKSRDGGDLGTMTLEAFIDLVTTDAQPRF
jgi:threonyl-tRNA synthetase